jgi:undecaprenyl-diphosphatase
MDTRDEGAQQQPAPATIGSTVAETIEGGARPHPLLLRAALELDALDRAAYAAVASTASPSLDVNLRRLSHAADAGVLWMGVAGALALGGGAAGRRAARHGLAALALSSAVVNLGLKPLFDRARPKRATDPSPRYVDMPSSTSFPSGHAASALAFANAVAADLPVLALPIRAVATAVAYSRVHAGVHYPGDVVVGAMLGAVAADVVRSVAGRRRRA